MAVSFRPLCAPNRTRARRKPSRLRRRLVLEQLEDRTLLSNAPVLVKDINPNHLSANAGAWTSYQGLTFFAADDGIHGSQLWKTNGTAKGTVMFTDINPPAPNPFYGGGGATPYDLTVSQGLLFFTADDGIHGRTLWKTDGTPGGTAMVADINPGRGPFIGTDFRGLIPFNGSLYFFAQSATGASLWKTDGTAAGTVVVTTKVAPANFYMKDLTTSGGALYFAGTGDGGLTEGLWKSDGTDAGTVELATFSSGTPPTDLTDIGGTLYFTPSGTAQLWKSNGTGAGTVLVDDIGPGSNLYDLTGANGLVFFTADDGTNGRQVWRSDRTVPGTFLLKVINPLSSIGPSSLTALNGQLFWSQGELWKSDGTSAGTVMVKDIFPGPEGSYPSDLTVAFNKLFFAANDGVHGNELWRSDGTTAGTALFKDINPNNTGPIPSSYPTLLAFVNGKLFFQASPLPQNGEPWTSDGTPAETEQLAQINQRTFGSTNVVGNAVAIGGTYYFPAAIQGVGIQLWKSDGTAKGTVSFTNNTLFGGRKEIRYLTNVGGALYFVTIDEVGFFNSPDWSLWKSDGTTSGTVLVDDFGHIPFSRYGPPPLFDLVGAGHTLFFLSTMGGFGEELWSSNGTAAGTHVLDINPAPYAGSYPFGLRAVKGTLYFAANDGTHGYELWKSDGTVAGTVLVKDINTSTAYGFAHGSYPYGFTEFKGSIYFSANDGVHGNELWKTDGTTAGTVLAVDIVPGSTGSYPGSLTKSGGQLFFSANDGLSTAELWKSDGTAAGTVKVTDIEPGSGDLGIFSLIAFEGGVLFQVIDSTGGTEIWDSDGTAAGTVLLAHFTNIVGEFVPLQLTSVGTTAYFVVDDGVHGQELWQTDGTPAGTFLTADLFPGPYGSNPHNLANVDGTLLFEAHDFIHSYELFKVPPPDKKGGDGERSLAATSTDGKDFATGLGSTGINALLPAAAPVSSVVGAPVTPSKPAGLPSETGGTKAAFFASLSVAPQHAPSMPSPDFGDALDSGAIDAMFAAIR